MRNFSLKKKESSHRNFKGVLTWGMLPIVIALLFVFIGHGALGGALAKITAPLFSLRAWTTDSFDALPSYFRDRSQFVGRITTLEEELARLESEYQSGTYLEDENARLRTLLGTDDEAARIAVGVLARPPFLPYDTMMIDRGSSDGIVEGAVVYQHADQVIGVVERTFKTSALVTLLSSPGVQTAVYVIGPDIYTKASGEGGGTLRISVPQDIELTEGDMVVLPGLEHGILGAIATIRKEPTEPDQSGYVTIGSMASLRYVSVGTRIPPSVTFEEASAYVAEQKELLFKVPVPEGLQLGATTTATSTDATGTSTDDTVNTAL